MPLQKRTKRSPADLLTEELLKCNRTSEVLDAVQRVFAATFNFPLAIVLRRNESICVEISWSSFIPDPLELRLAEQAIRCCMRVGPGTDQMPYARSCFIPLTTNEGAIGTLGFRPDRRIQAQEWEKLFSFANATSLALMRASLAEELQHVEGVTEADRFHTVLLNSIAHNLRTPLASIIGVLSTLQEDTNATQDQNFRGELLETARSEAERLNRLLQNLLDLSRLEAGALRVRMDPCDVQDLIGAALEQLGAIAETRAIEVTIPPDMPFVRMDFVLIVQVLVNLLENAIKYSPERSPIMLTAVLRGPALEVSVSDCGDGIPEADLDKIFEKFNRAARSGETGGIGLGLSICKGLVEIHHGHIWAQPREPRGTTVTFSIPVEQSEDVRR